MIFLKLILDFFSSSNILIFFHFIQANLISLMCSCWFDLPQKYKHWHLCDKLDLVHIMFKELNGIQMATFFIKRTQAVFSPFQQWIVSDGKKWYKTFCTWRQNSIIRLVSSTEVMIPGILFIPFVEFYSVVMIDSNSFCWGEGLKNVWTLCLILSTYRNER